MFTLDRVVPWGRSFDEYRRMFALSDGDLDRRILGCADGPASFNAEATARGSRVVSCDPLYRFSADAIGARIDDVYEQVIDQTRANADTFVWTTIASVEQLGNLRRTAMDLFLGDFANAAHRGRYVAAALPALPFRDDAFDLVVSSHFLFLYSDHFDTAFHVDSALELTRVAHEVRIFPLLTLAAQPSPRLAAVAHAAEARGCRVSIETVPYEFQRGSNQMMRVTRHLDARRRVPVS